MSVVHNRHASAATVRGTHSPGTIDLTIPDAASRLYGDQTSVEPTNATTTGVGSVSTGSVQAGTHIDGSIANITGVSTPATVTIDATGITILNGALFLQDEFGASALGASGFVGSWNDYVRLGLYNGGFGVGIVGALTAGRTVSLPYWNVSLVGTGTASYNASGYFNATGPVSGDGASAQSDMVPVMEAVYYSILETITLSAGAGANTATASFSISFYNSALTLISTSTPESFSSTSSSVGPVTYQCTPVIAPSTAKWARVNIKGITTGLAAGGNSVSFWAVGLVQTPPKNLSNQDLLVASVAASGTVYGTNLPLNVDKGSVGVPVSASVTGTVGVSFASVFSSTPNVVAVSSSSVSYNVSVSGITTSGCTINVRHIDATSTTTTVTVQWIAMN